MKHLSRREFAALTVAGAAMSRVVSPLARGLTPGAATVTAAEIAERIKKHIGVAWTTDGVDTFKAGDSSMVVTGVVTTSMATLDVLQQAVRAGANLIITSQPTFYSRADAPPAGRGAGVAAGAAAGAGRGQGARGGGAPAQAPPPSPATQFGPGTGASAAMPPAPALLCRRRSCRRWTRVGRRGGRSTAGHAESGLRRQDGVHRKEQAHHLPTQRAFGSRPQPESGTVAGIANLMGWTKVQSR